MTSEWVLARVWQRSVQLWRYQLHTGMGVMFAEGLNKVSPLQKETDHGPRFSQKTNQLEGTLHLYGLAMSSHPFSYIPWSPILPPKRFRFVNDLHSAPLFAGLMTAASRRVFLLYWTEQSSTCCCCSPHVEDSRVLF
ncbi:hypothetical protein MPTK1_3g04430 [Marchantia polymorpha subsp. ruderalis]|uniref:Uncharacterized protein n=2 Tax=Marchantia polymorpha TaxID=3197 RepID=A0AAF6AXD6_MARPO|nr:hypothetical protein MARPO_0022s0088 [Marchantia polymorpha]BBN04420.1 hypothetical protein Mp_3g04430 [Marchantia polymorpha subsp. ruderalis]|eukprot:PTQ43984.1 hypothetical protein MARPO_0022s0088 [Marchantia polymorpha]